MLAMHAKKRKTPARERKPSSGSVSVWQRRFAAAWSRSDALFRLIREEDFLTRPIVWRHPFIFYVGHLPAFAWNQICGSILKWKSRSAHFDDLFCRGMDPDVDTGECHWH